MDAPDLAAVPVEPPRSTRRHLREATAAAHSRAEAATATGDRLTPAAYVRCLALFHGLWAPTQEVLERWSAGDETVWRVQDRARLARADLIGFGVGPGTMDRLPRCGVEPPEPGPEGAPTTLGYTYVLEGSGLGAAMIARRLQVELPEAPRSFFSKQDFARWPAFTRYLDGQGWDQPFQERAAEAAQRLFGAFTALASIAHHE